jgi:rubrerythrin
MRFFCRRADFLEKRKVMATLFNADEVFKIGVQIEKNGLEFYLAAAKKTKDPDCKKLFSQLASWETRHAELFENLRAKLPSNLKDTDIFDPENEIHLYLKSVSDSTVFVKGSEIEKEIGLLSSSVAILEKALTFEKDSVVFYSSMKQIVSDELGKTEIDSLIMEEIFHVAQLTKEINKLK